MISPVAWEEEKSSALDRDEPTLSIPGPTLRSLRVDAAWAPRVGSVWNARPRPRLSQCCGQACACSCPSPAITSKTADGPSQSPATISSLQARTPTTRFFRISLASLSCLPRYVKPDIHPRFFSPLSFISAPPCPVCLLTAQTRTRPSLESLSRLNGHRIGLRQIRCHPASHLQADPGRRLVPSQ